MSKKPSKTNRAQTRCLIDHIPHCRRKPRTAGSPRRRTEFSPFFPSPSTLPITLSACGSSQDTRRRLFSTANDIPVAGVESVGENALFEASNGRNFDKENRSSMRTSELIPDKSLVTECSTVCVAPGSLVWAKNATQEWWPAEVMGERSTVVDSPVEGVDGLVLIQYFGTHQSAWLDPARCLSEFDECFEERSCNPNDEFQDSLKQALHQREHHSLSKQFSGPSDDCNHLNQGYQTPDKWNSSSSSKTESPCGEMRRGKRARKPKLHFDEEPLPLTLARGVRRIKIMRSLGLAAPLGSPF